MGSLIYDSAACTLDLDSIVYDGDLRSLSGLLLDSEFVQLSEELLKDNPVARTRKDLMKKCLHLTRRMAPRLYANGDRCREILGLKAELDFYVYEDYSANAACYPPENGKYYILISSALLEKFDDQEMTFVLGHEIGHALFDHHCLPTGLLLERGKGRLSPVHAMKIFAWKRNKEISADRIGLLCSQSFEAVARAFFKLSSGVQTESIQFHLGEYLKQFVDLKSELSEDSKNDPQDWYSTHPFSPMRIKALEIFERSEVYRQFLGRSSEEALSRSETEGQIKEFMILMEPAYLSDEGEIPSVARKFVFMGGYLIASANGKIEDCEWASLSSLLSRDTIEEGLKSVQSISLDQIKADISELALKLVMHLPPISRLNLIKDLAVISYADGSVDEDERAVLYSLCLLLEIQPDFADQVIASAAQIKE